MLNRIFAVQFTDKVEANKLTLGFIPDQIELGKVPILPKKNLGQKKMIQFLLLVFCISRTFAVKCYVDNQVAMSLNETFTSINFSIYFMNKDAVQDNI